MKNRKKHKFPSHSTRVFFSSFTFKAIFITSYFFPQKMMEKTKSKAHFLMAKSCKYNKSQKTSPRAGILLIYLPLCRNFALKYILDCPLQSPHSATKIWLNNISRRMAKENGNKENLSSIFHEEGKKSFLGFFLFFLCCWNNFSIYSWHKALNLR